MSIPNDLITPKAAASLLQFHVSVVYSWIKQGRLRSWRRGSLRLLVSRADVLAQIQPVERAEEGEVPEEVKARLKAHGIDVG